MQQSTTVDPSKPDSPQSEQHLPDAEGTVNNIFSRSRLTIDARQSVPASPQTRWLTSWLI